MLELGMKYTAETAVTNENTAEAVGSGGLRVFATPAMAALMEKAAMLCVSHELEAGCGTVGTVLNIRHVSATPLSMNVKCTAELTEIDGRRLVFKVEAYDEAGLIGDGVHERFIIKNESFMKKTEAKLEK